MLAALAASACNTPLSCPGKELYFRGRCLAKGAPCEPRDVYDPLYRQCRDRDGEPVPPAIVPAYVDLEPAEFQRSFLRVLCEMRNRCIEALDAPHYRDVEPVECTEPVRVVSNTCPYDPADAARCLSELELGACDGPDLISPPSCSNVCTYAEGTHIFDGRLRVIGPDPATTRAFWSETIAPTEPQLASLTLHAGQTYLFAAESEHADPAIELYDPRAERVAANDDAPGHPTGDEAYLMFTARDTGTYQLRVRTSPTDYAASYSVQVWRPQPSRRGLTTLGDHPHAFGSLALPEDTDRWLLPRTNFFYTVSLWTDAGSPGRFELSILDPGGNLVARGDTTSATRSEDWRSDSTVAARADWDTVIEVRRTDSHREPAAYTFAVHGEFTRIGVIPHLPPEGEPNNIPRRAQMLEFDVDVLPNIARISGALPPQDVRDWFFVPAGPGLATRTLSARLRTTQIGSQLALGATLFRPDGTPLAEFEPAEDGNLEVSVPLTHADRVYIDVTPVERGPDPEAQIYLLEVELE